jgi:hypothetical protein
MLYEEMFTSLNVLICNFVLCIGLGINGIQETQGFHENANWIRSPCTIMGLL